MSQNICLYLITVYFQITLYHYIHMNSNNNKLSSTILLFLSTFFYVLKTPHYYLKKRIIIIVVKAINYHLKVLLRNIRNGYLCKNVYLSIYLPFPVLCIPLRRFEFLSQIIFLHHEEPPFTFLVVQVTARNKFSQLLFI